LPSTGTIFRPNPCPRAQLGHMAGAGKDKADDGDTQVSECGALGDGVRASRRDVRGRPRPLECVFVAEVANGEG
jgi:hypothetical protein